MIWSLYCGWSFVWYTIVYCHLHALDYSSFNRWESYSFQEILIRCTFTLEDTCTTSKPFHWLSQFPVKENMDIEITESDFNGKETFFDIEKVRRGQVYSMGCLDMYLIKWPSGGCFFQEIWYCREILKWSVKLYKDCSKHTTPPPSNFSGL